MSCFCVGGKASEASGLVMSNEDSPCDGRRELGCKSSSEMVMSRARTEGHESATWRKMEFRMLLSSSLGSFKSNRQRVSQRSLCAKKDCSIDRHTYIVNAGDKGQEPET